MSSVNMQNRLFGRMIDNIPEPNYKKSVYIIETESGILFGTVVVITNIFSIQEQCDCAGYPL